MCAYIGPVLTNDNVKFIISRLLQEYKVRERAAVYFEALTTLTYLKYVNTSRKRNSLCNGCTHASLCV